MEYSLLLNPLPDPQRRSAQAAERSVALDPLCQAGWAAQVSLRFFDRDRSRLLVAAERVVALNPLDTTTMSHIGLMLAGAGEWERGVEIIERAIDLNPHVLGWAHTTLAVNHYRKGEFEQAQVRATRSGLMQFVQGHCLVATRGGTTGPRRRCAIGARDDSPERSGVPRSS